MVGTSLVLPNSDACLVEYPRRWEPPCTAHGFWPRYCHSEPPFDSKHFGTWGPYRAVDCARNSERRGDIQQRSGCFLFCDGHDRGASRTNYSHRTLAYHRLYPSQAFTGAVPFSRSLPAAAMLAIMGGKRPPRPTHRTFTPYLWALMQRCWDQDPLSRPEASEIWRVLTGT